MNTFKKTGGFTLVELIIVIAILAILSSVAVAGYSSYIKKANDSAVETYANNVKTHAVLANAESAADITVTFTYVESTNKVTAKITAGNFAKNFASDFNAAFDVTLQGWKDENTKATGNDVVAFYTFEDDAPTAWKGSNYNVATENQTIPSAN